MRASKKEVYNGRLIMLKYEIKMERQGSITSMPDSQRIFGFLMNMLKEYLTEDNITEFVLNIKKCNEICMISNLMPTGYIPTPKKYVLDTVSQKENKKEIYKELKKIDYIKPEKLKKILDKHTCLETKKTGGYFNLKEDEYLSKTRTFQQKFNLKSQSLGLDGYPNQAYTIPILKVVNENLLETNKFSFFILIENGSNIAMGLDALKDDLKNLGGIDCFLGAKASYGYNCYKIDDIEQTSYNFATERKKYLNLGMLLPNQDCIEWEKYHLEIHTSDRNSYDIYNKKKKVISFIKEGSVIELTKDAGHKNIGISIENPYNLSYKSAIVFGNSYFIEI